MGPSSLGREQTDHVVGHTKPSALPARKQLPKRTIQDVLEEQSEDKGREAKRKKEEDGEEGGGRRGLWHGHPEGGDCLRGQGVGAPSLMLMSLNPPHQHCYESILEYPHLAVLIQY